MSARLQVLANVLEQPVVLCLLLGTLAILQAVVGPLLLGAPLGGALLNGYVAAGLCLYLLSQIMERLQRDPARHVFDTTIGGMVQRRQGMGPARLWALRLLVPALRIACWPAFEYIAMRFNEILKHRRVRSVFAANAALTLFPLPLVISVYLAIAAATTTVAALLLGPPLVHARLFMWLLIVALALKHVWHLVSPLDMQQTLRFGLGSVRITYAIITFCDLLCLLLAYNAVINWQSGRVLDAASLSALFTSLRVFADLFEAFEKPPADVIGWAVGVSGGLWLWSLANALTKWQAYERTEADHLEIGGAAATLGMEDRAREAMAKVTEPDRRQLLRLALFHLTLGDVEGAIAHARRLVRQFEGLEAGPNHLLLLTAGGIPAAPDPAVPLIAWAARAIADGASEAVLADVLLSTRIVGADAGEVLAWFEGEGHAATYPLAHMCLKWDADEEREVLGFYDAYAAPAEPGARLALWRAVGGLLLPARRMPREQALAWMATWNEAGIADIRRGAAAASDAAEVFCLCAVLQRLEPYLGKFGFEVQGLAEVIAECEPVLANDPAIRMLRQIAGMLANPAVAAAAQPASPRLAAA
jgi:hypothetical protein